MVSKWRKVLYAMVLLFGIPIFIITSFYIYTVIPSIALMDMRVLVAILLLIYSILVTQEVSYDSKRINSIDMRDIPQEMRDILTKTTDRGHLINIKIIQALAKDNKNQSQLCESVRKDGVELTDPAIIPYIKLLEEAGLLSLTPQIKEIKWNLTERGKLVLKIIPQYFPRTYCWFVYRNVLGRRKIPKLEP